MADLTDVEAKIVSIIDAAIYPNGDTQPSAMPNATAVKIGRGWPLPAALDADLAAQKATITVFPLGGSAIRTFQILNETYVISAAAVTSVATVNGEGITVSGTLSQGEFLTVIIDDAVICSQTGANVAAMLAALATQVQGFGYAAVATATTLTVPFGHSMVVRQGGQAVMGRVIHRQIHSIMVTVWAPNDTIRTAAAILADVALKENIKITMPDTSQCLLRYSRTASSDAQEKANLYRRDLIYDAEFATVQQFPGYTITSTQVSIANPSNTAIATALT
jgi:hypothetical protein